MPYGGEDSLKEVAKMERCVREVQAKNPSWSKSRCIATCKVSLGISKGGKRRGKD
jgi:hypothetical protein